MGTLDKINEYLEKMEEKEERRNRLIEAKKPPKGTLYIKNSSIFDSPANKYDTKLFMKILKQAGAKKVWTDNVYGWSNQPEVVLFTGLKEEDAEEALMELPVFKKWGPIIQDAYRDWDVNENIEDRLIEAKKIGGKEYDDYFKSMLKKWKIKSYKDLPKKKQKEFFDAVDKGWEAKKETD